MKINEHNKIKDYNCNISVNKQYNEKLDTYIDKREFGYSFYINLFLNVKFSNGSNVMRVKTCQTKEQMKMELREKYKRLQLLSISNRIPINIIKINVSSCGIPN